MLTGWSLAGRIEAARIIGVSIHQIPTTNNHLEGFNSAFKEIYLKKHQNRGHRLRLDVFAITLVKHIIPNIMLGRELSAKLALQLQERQRQHVEQKLQNKKATTDIFPHLVFFHPNENRDKAARKIVEDGGVKEFEITNDGKVIVYVRSDTSWNTTYTVTVSPLMDINCECLDQKSRGGFCKHLRASFIHLTKLRKQPQYQHIPNLPIPTKEHPVIRLPAECEEVESSAETAEIIQHAMLESITEHDVADVESDSEESEATSEMDEANRDEIIDINNENLEYSTKTPQEEIEDENPTNTSLLLSTLDPEQHDAAIVRQEYAQLRLRLKNEILNMLSLLKEARELREAAERTQLLPEDERGEVVALTHEVESLVQTESWTGALGRIVKNRGSEEGEDNVVSVSEVSIEPEKQTRVSKTHGAKRKAGVFTVDNEQKQKRKPSHSIY